MKAIDEPGFTLIELVIVIAVVAVLMSVAVPSFQSALAESRQVSVFNKMSGTLRFARSEAIKRSKGVSICPFATNTSCGTDWSAGMLVYVDARDDGAPLVYDGEDATIRTIALSNSGISLQAHALLDTGTTTATTGSIRFNARGQPNWLNGTMVLCDARGSTHASALVMTGSGIARKAYSTASTDGVVVDALGSAVSCDS